MRFKTAARWCAALAATGILAGGASAAAAARVPSTEPGVPTGQMSVQLFNYIAYLLTGQRDSSPPNPVPSTPGERMARVFQYLSSQGVKNVEAFSFGAIPIPGTTPAELRALGDQYAINITARHGDVVEGTWDQEIANAKTLGMEYIGSGGVPLPGIGSYADTLATAQALNRLGKRSVEAGVGPVYFHNHQQEFRTKYTDDGALKSAFEILLDHTDPRYVAAELDVLWAYDGGADPVALLNEYGARIVMLHMKDGRNVAAPADATPVPFGTGEINYTPVINAAKNRVHYYIYEQDPPLDILFGGPTPPNDPFADGAISFANLKGDPAPSLYALPPAFPAGQRGGTTGTSQTVTVRNRGDAPLTITAAQVQASAPDAAAANDFVITGQTCTSAPIAPDGTCTVSVAFKPTRAVTTSLARIQFTSNADDATETVMLVAKSGNALDVSAPVGGEVPATLSLTMGPAASFGTFQPGVARDYTGSGTATVISSAGDATLSVADPSTTNTGKLVNGSFALPQAVQAGVGGVFAAVGGSAAPTPLKTWTGPTSNESVTVDFKQSIGANDALRTGAYGKTLTFTLSTTTP